MTRIQAVLAVVTLVLGAAAIALLTGGREERAPAPPPRGETARAAEPPARVVRAIDLVRRQAEHSVKREEADGVRQVASDPRDEMEARRQKVAAFAADRGRTEPVARRFFAAFASYELGDSSGPVAERLRATATSAFARELLGARPARLPPGMRKPPRATLVGLDFVPGESDGERLATMQFVAAIDRGGDRTSLAISLRRVDGAWFVDSLGR